MAASLGRQHLQERSQRSQMSGQASAAARQERDTHMAAGAEGEGGTATGMWTWVLAGGMWREIA